MSRARTGSESQPLSVRMIELRNNCGGIDRRGLGWGISYQMNGSNGSEMNRNDGSAHDSRCGILPGVGASNRMRNRCIKVGAAARGTRAIPHPPSALNFENTSHIFYLQWLFQMALTISKIMLPTHPSLVEGLRARL